MRLMKELLDSMITKYELLSKENKEIKNTFAKFDKIMENKKEMKKELGNIKKENEDLKEKCVSYEAQLEDLKG